MHTPEFLIFITAVAKTFLRYQATSFNCLFNKDGQFATFFYGVYDSRTSTMTFCNAGQCPALHVREDYVDRLGEGGLILGVRPGQRYEEGRVHLDQGDLILLYTVDVVFWRTYVPRGSDAALEDSGTVSAAG